MKSLLLFLSLLASTIGLKAQLHLPELSPDGMITQQVGYTKMAIRYGRPAARGRQIFGDLVPYKRLWRTGAGNGTTISFDRPVTIGNKTIAAGTYALVTVPDVNEWTILINTDTSKLYGDPSEYSTAFEIVRLQVKPEKSSRFYESLTFDIEIANYDAIIYLSWENTQIKFPVGTNSDKEAMDEIRAALEKDPSDPEIFSSATFYYYMNNKNMNDALSYINKALALREDRWYYHQKVDVLARLGNFSLAKKTAHEAIAFLQRTQPTEWQGDVAHLHHMMEKWK